MWQYNGQHIEWGDFYFQTTFCCTLIFGASVNKKLGWRHCRDPKMRQMEGAEGDVGNYPSPLSKNQPISGRSLQYIDVNTIN